MFRVAGKILLWFSLVFINTAKAQPNFTFYNCAEFGSNGTYQSNLDTTLLALPTSNSSYGFYNLSIGQGNERVNVVALCRGDVQPDVCRSCLNDSIVKLPKECHNQKEAVGYYDYCMLRYSDHIIRGNTQRWGASLLSSIQNASDRVGFSRALRPLMNQLIVDAAAGGPFKFATGNTTGPNLTTIYGLVQCTPDLTQGECSACLEGALNQFASSFSAAVGGQGFLPTCKFRNLIQQYYKDEKKRGNLKSKHQGQAPRQAKKNTSTPIQTEKETRGPQTVPKGPPRQRHQTEEKNNTSIPQVDTTLMLPRST